VANAKISIPGVAFLLPAVYLLMSIDIHYKYSARVAGMSSFLAALVDSVGRSDVNWERDIKLFAAQASGPLSTKLPVAIIYFIIIAICLVLGASSSFTQLGVELTPPSFLDTCVTVLGALVIPVAFYRTIHRARDFFHIMAEYDRFWSSTIAARTAVSLPTSVGKDVAMDAQAPIASELAQATVVGHHARLADLAPNFVGCLAALLLVVATRALASTRRKPRVAAGSSGHDP
jgi:VanZ family protein